MKLAFKKYDLVCFTGCLLSYFFIFRAGAQSLTFDRFSVNNGLSNSHIYSILQDSTGFIWIGTEDGLNRFDGYSFRIYRNVPGDTNSLPDNVIYALYNDTGDDFWVATNAGVARYVSEYDCFENIPFYRNTRKADDVQVNDVLKTSKGIVLAATNMGLFEYVSGKKQFQPVFSLPVSNPVFYNGNISRLYEDRQRNLWIGFLNLGVWVYRNVQRTFQEITPLQEGDLFKNCKILAIYEDNNRFIWLGTEKGLYCYDLGLQQIVRGSYFLPPRLPHKQVCAIFQDSRNRLWIGTDGGLVQYFRENETFHPYFHDDFDDHSLSNNAIACIYEDKQKNLWIGTKEGGMNLSRARFIQFNHLVKQAEKRPGLNYAYVLSVMEDNEGNLWIGTNGGGINFYDRKAKRFVYYTPKNSPEGGIREDAVQTICQDREGNIWFGTYGGGLTVLNRRTGIFRTFRRKTSDSTSLLSNIVNTVYSDRNGTLWIGTHGGINLMKLSEPGIFKPLVQGNDSLHMSLTSSFVTFFLEDYKGRMWIGTYKGLNRYDPGRKEIEQFMHTKGDNSLSNNAIYALYEDHNHVLWVGTGNGLNRYDEETGTFRVYYDRDGLPNNTINGMIEDDRGNLWISTNQGLSMFDPAIERFVNFGTEDGLGIIEFHHGAFNRGKSGNFYFGGKSGLTYFNPDYFSLQSFVYPLVITDFRIFNTPVAGGKNSFLLKSVTRISNIILSYNQSFVSFGFSALNFVNPGKDQYSYFLEGYDHRWVNAQNYRYASYSNLPPGKYVLHIKVINSLTGVSAAKSVRITVTPPFWRSPVSFVAYAIVLFLIIYLVFGYLRARNLYRQNLIMERIEREKMQEVNQTKFRFFINMSHELKTPLTLIISPVEKLLRQEQDLEPGERKKLYRIIYRNAGRLSRLVSQIMDLRRLDAGKTELNAAETDLVEFVYSVARYFDDYAFNHLIEFAVKTQTQQLMVWIDREKFEKILFNLLSNAFKYTPDGGKVTVSVGSKRDASSDVAQVCVADTGIGIPPELQDKIFERFYQAPVQVVHNSTSSGIGLSIVKEFVELHRGSITLTSKPGEGSVFCVSIPLGNKHLKPEEMITRVDEHVVIHNPLENSEEALMSVKEEQTGREISDPGRSKRKILLVEDNYELRNFLIDSLDEMFDVYEAADGEEGLNMVYDILPEIVISDVMMPKMNGTELCRAIKADVRISHIPVILITVLDSEKDKIEGLESGADDYLVKPFNLRVLELKIANIIETRQKLVRKFLQETNPDLRFMARTGTDEVFLQKATEIVEKHLPEPDFSAEDFSREMGMSRSNVHVKLRALAHQSTTEFIRTLRLKKAAVLLMTGQYNISEVCFKVGFNNISYFNRCFKKHFGMTPSEYLDKTLAGK
ncbi:MAG: hybrid sensor histidine kinase/response regulator transcription factor [Bacteroidales bacterium]